MGRSILHVDMNNFYASVECMLNPDLRGKPVAVCGSIEDRHGIVLAKNYEAKAYGIKTAEPVAQAKKKCGSLVIVPPHFEEYIKYSNLAREIYSEYTDLIEPFGIDECWLDITGTRRLFGEPEEVAHKIRRTIKKELELTVSVGVSFNKVFAKLGSDMKKPDAVTVIHEDGFKDEIWDLPAGDMLGVGPRTADLLAKYSVNTIGELAKSRPEWISHLLGKNGLAAWRYANGHDCSPVLQKDFVIPAKSVGHGITTASDIANNEQAFAVLLELAQDIGHRLRVQKKCASGVAVAVRNNQLDVKQWQAPLPIPTQSPTIIASGAYALFSSHYSWDYPIRALTITAINLTEQDEPRQTDFFSDAVRLDKLERADGCIEKIRRRFGDGIIKNAVLMQNLGLPKGNYETMLPKGAAVR